MRNPRPFATAVVVIVFSTLIYLMAKEVFGATGSEPAIASQTPALTVEATRPSMQPLPILVHANGNIAAWQEVIVSSEASGLRVTETRADVGDVVRRGQVLAVFASETVVADMDQSRAAAEEAEALLALASAAARGARDLQSTGAMSEQQILQYLTDERTARTRLESARAAEATQRIRIAQTRILAPDDGVISARSATVGAVLASGQELFRMVRRGRLEWRAEVSASDLAKLDPGEPAIVTPVGGGEIEGTVRVVAPTVDTRTGNGTVYVDLPSVAAVRAGIFARGVLEVGESPAMTLPQAAVLVHDGFSHVMRIGADSRVMQTKITTGRRDRGRIEIVDGIGLRDRVVASGGSFLGDGDLVRVVESQDPGTRALNPAGADAVPGAAR